MVQLHSPFKLYHRSSSQRFSFISPKQVRIRPHVPSMLNCIVPVPPLLPLLLLSPLAPLWAGEAPETLLLRCSWAHPGIAAVAVEGGSLFLPVPLRCSPPTWEQVQGKGTHSPLLSPAEPGSSCSPAGVGHE